MHNPCGWRHWHPLHRWQQHRGRLGAAGRAVRLRGVHRELQQPRARDHLYQCHRYSTDPTHLRQPGPGRHQHPKRLRVNSTWTAQRLCESGHGRLALVPRSAGQRAHQRAIWGRFHSLPAPGGFGIVRLCDDLDPQSPLLLGRYAAEAGQYPRMGQRHSGSIPARSGDPQRRQLFAACSAV